MNDSRFSELVKELNEPMKIEIKEMNHQGIGQAPDMLQVKQFELVVEMMMKKLDMKLDALREDVSHVKHEVERLKVSSPVQQQVAHVEQQVQNQPVQPPAQHHPDSIQVPQDIKVEGFMEVKSPHRNVMSSTAEHAKNEGTGMHPRLGNYKTEDVSVEKFFHFGGKR